MNNDFVFKFELISNDYVKFNKWYNRKAKLYNLLIVIIGFVMSQSFSGFKDQDLLVWNITLFLTLYMFLMLFFVLYIIIKSKILFKNDIEMNSKRIVKLTDEKITKNSQYENIEMKLDNLYRLVKNKGDLYFMTAPNKGIILPKRVLNGDIKLIAELLKRNNL